MREEKEGKRARWRDEGGRERKVGYLHMLIEAPRNQERKWKDSLQSVLRRMG